MSLSPPPQQKEFNWIWQKWLHDLWVCVKGNAAGRFVSFKDYNAVGDGATDDAAAILAAINGSSGKVVDGGGATYRMDSVIAPTAENIVIQNAVFDISNIADQGGSPDFVITFAGTQGTATNLSSNALAGANVLAVADTSSFAAEQWSWLESTATFDTGTSTVLGQYVKVKTVDNSTQLTLYNDVLYDFNTSDTAKISAVTPKENITFRNCKFIGSGANNQGALYFSLCQDITVDSCLFELCHYSSVSVSRTVNFLADNCTVRYARSAGLSYGITIGNGCYSARIANGYAEDLRHYVTVGDNDGVNLFVTVSGNHIAACSDAGIDAHAACDFMVIDGNTVEGSTDGTTADGIIFQGLNCVISNNTVVGIKRHGIFHQCLPEIGIGSTVITGNSVINSGGSASTDMGIYVDNESVSAGVLLSGITINGNVIRGVNEIGIQVYANTGNIENVSVVGNSILATTTRGILIRALAGLTLDRANITGNTIEGNSGTTGIALLGVTAINITNVSISGNVIDDFTYGIYADYADEVIESGNIITNFSDPYEIDDNSTNIRLDNRRFATRTITNSTDILEEDDGHLICNRAATITITLRPASVFTGGAISIKTIQAQTVVSASSNVVPIDSATAGTAILPATDGAWCLLRSDGTNWVIMQEG